MSDRPDVSSSRPPHGHDTPLWWLLAGGAGMMGAATLALVGSWSSWPLPLAALTCVAIGMLGLVLTAPWRGVAARRADRAALAQLARWVRQMTEDERPGPLRELILDRDDEIGQVSRAVHDALAEVITNRQQARRLHRTMGDSIRRETHRQTAALQKQATTDALTGLGNRRALELWLDGLRRQRHLGDEPVVLMTFDLDRFKQINDRLGHEVGDRCLAFLGQLLRCGTRREDCAIRLGGDEFVVVMPGRALDDARRMARRLRELYRQMPWPHEPVQPPTLSVGVALGRLDELDDGRQLLRRADEALYSAKRAGGAQVVVYDEVRGAA